SDPEKDPEEAGAARQPGPTESDLRRCRVEQEDIRLRIHGMR
nr:hypothetical protein [Tanacetum cinerariifolium]